MIKARLNLDLAHKIADSLDTPLPAMYCTADIMTRNIKSLTLDNNVGDFLSFMKKNKVRHVAIFDSATEAESKPFFTGIISERDVLRFTNPYTNSAGTDRQNKNIMKKVLVQVVTRNPICVSPDTPIHRLIAIMIKNHIDMVPVLDETELVGIVTSTDILKLLVTFDTAVRRLSQKFKTSTIKNSIRSAALTEWIDRTAGDIMTAKPRCLALKDTVEKAVDLFRKKRFRHVLITDKNDRLMGIVSDRDILRHLPYVNLRPKHSQEQFLSMPSDTPGLETQLAHIMEWEITSITEDCSVASATKKLLSEHLSCLPVLDADGNISGIITANDLIQVLLKACKPLA